MNTELQTKRAFTLIELVVAVAILALIASFAGVVFSVSIGSHRTALANAEIMQKLRAITDQLNRDFKGIRQDAPMAIQFRRVDGTRRDSIVFFANGDFQSVRQYEYERSDKTRAFRTVSGNVASIYYGQANNDPNILTRKQKILTSDTSLIGLQTLVDPNEFLKESLGVWRVGLDDNSFVHWLASPHVDLSLEEHLPLYMTEGVGNFTIQFAEWNQATPTFIWFPDNLGFNPPWDTDGNGMFGFFYNVPGGVVLDDWHDESANWPEALRFTFTLYDSRGIITEGRTFTHIVYLGD